MKSLLKKTALAATLFFMLCTAASAQMPYVVSLSMKDTQSVPGLQSFCHALYGGKLLVFGGRTNGFHLTSTRESTFPTVYANEQFSVIDLATRQVWSMPIPTAYMAMLRSTNMQCYQDGSTLYCCGGYGSTCDADSASCYQTFPNLTAINVPLIMNLVMSGKDPSSAIVSITDERMRTGGGSLQKMGNYFYLVFGHNFHTIYKGGLTGIYTEQIRKFQINYDGTNLSIANYQTISTPLTYQGLSQFHRRDLNVYPTVMTDKSIGIGIFGGVFTTQAGPFPNPISVEPSVSSTDLVRIDTTFQQRFCLYECPAVLVYDSLANRMFTTLLGGITDYYYDQNNQITPSNFSNFMPFFNHASTMVREASGSYSEYPQLSPALPGYLGANGIFIPAPGLPYYQGTEIINLNKLPGGPVLVGWMYGGIMATAPQASQFNPTFASTKIYEIYIQKNVAAKH